jgi:hypothetical protein
LVHATVQPLAVHTCPLEQLAVPVQLACAVACTGEQP